MVPFTFEKIARSASFDPPSAFPVSAAARATHESFESHLQRATATTADQSTRKPAQEDEPREPSASGEHSGNEPVRQNSNEPQRDDRDVRRTDDAKATKTTEPPGERDDEDEDVELDDASQGEIIIVITDDDDEPSSAVQEIELESSGDPETVAAVSNEEIELDPSSAAESEESADQHVIKFQDEAPAVSELKRVSGEQVEDANSATPARRVTSSDTNEEFPEATPVAETTSSDDKPPQADNTPQRRGHRDEISPNQRAHERPDTAPKPVAVHVVETAIDTPNEDGSRQRPHHQETNASQLTGNTAPTDVTTTTPGTPSRFAQHLLARTEDPNGRGLSITNADQARFVDRVTRAVQATGERGGTLRLRLSPPELGSLTLEVKVQGGVVNARVEADTPAARSLLLENLPLLRERLAEHGMRVDQFDVDLTDRHAGGTPDGLQQNDQQPEDRPRAKARSHDPDDTPQTIAGEMPTKNGNEQLNIIV